MSDLTGDPVRGAAHTHDLFCPQLCHDLTAALEAAEARIKDQADTIEALRVENRWATQFECPSHGDVSFDEITTSKTHLGCGEGLIRRGFDLKQRVESLENIASAARAFATCTNPRREDIGGARGPVVVKVSPCGSCAGCVLDDALTALKGGAQR